MRRGFFWTALAVRLLTLFCGRGLAAVTAGRVDVYPGEAVVRISLAAEPAMSLELPSAFDPSSVTVSGEGDVKVAGLDVREVPRTGWVPPSLAPLAEEVEKAHAQVEVLSSRAASIAQGVKHLEAAVPEGLKEVELAAYVDAALKKREALELKASETKGLLEKAQKEYEALKAEYEGRFPGRPDRVVLVTFSTEGKGEVLLTARTDSARWRPLYRLELNSSTGEIRGVYGVEVNQKSGIDWDGEVVFHTVRPRGGVRIPDMPPLIADIHDPDKNKKAFELAMRAAAPALDGAAGEYLEEGLTDVAIRTSAAVNGSGEDVTIDAGTFTEESEVSLVCIPEYSPEAWTVATVKSLGRALLPGEARLSVDGKDTGRTRLEALSMGQEAVLPFGTTPLVTAEREEMIPTTGTSWIVKGKHQRGYIITVSNGLDKAVKVRVKDRVPVPANEAIKIQDVTLSPAPAERDEKGFLTWEIALDKGKSSQVSVKYTVTYPSDKELIFR